jgi:hypothetical protein
MYEQKLNELLEDTFGDFFGIESFELADEFCYYPSEDKITYTVCWQDNDDEFIELVNEKYNADIQPWFFIFCILHEIGHAETFDELTNEDLKTDLLLRNAIQFFENQGRAYINLRAEDLATSWALDFISNNETYLWEFQTECWKIMQKIYEEKGLTED